jgi:non-specific serine/threonine protein kinase
MAKIGNDIIDSKYEILKLLNTGGMNSAIYLALDKKLNRQWAIKKVRKSSSQTTSMLMAEASIMKNLDHPMLPRIVGIEEDPKFFYIIMDFVQGENLKTVVTSSGPQAQDTVVSWGVKLCDVLTYLHGKGIVYRDMKPANIMLSPDGNIKLIDFGIAREYKENASEDTTALGTEGYAAPEQYEGKGQTDARTDVYGMGITLFQLLTGVNPSSYQENIFSIRLQNPNLSSGLDKIILKCTNKDPKKRYQSTEELKKALLNYRKLDDKFLKKQKKVIKKFFTLLGLSTLCFVIAGGSFIASYFQKNNRYSALLSGVPSKANIIKAIDVKPSETAGYVALLNYYGKEIDQNELSEFSHIYGEHREDITDIEDVSMIAGEKILGSYSEKSIRAKLVAGEPYFNAASKKYSSAKIYVSMAEFYRAYIMQDDSAIVKEPSKKDYEKLLRGMNDILKENEKLDSDDKHSIMLASDQLILGLLSENADSMREQKISKSDLASIVSAVEKNLDNINTRVKVLKEKKEAVKASVVTAKEKIELAYNTPKEGGEE